MDERQLRRRVIRSAVGGAVVWAILMVGLFGDFQSPEQLFRDVVKWAGLGVVMGVMSGAMLYYQAKKQVHAARAARQLEDEARGLASQETASGEEAAPTAR